MMPCGAGAFPAGSGYPDRDSGRVAVHLVNVDVIIGMDAGAQALKAEAFVREGNKIDMARECRSDMVPVSGTHADGKCGAGR